MSAAPQVILARGDLTALMTPRDYLAAAEEAFRALGDGRAHAPAPLHMHVPNGVFHAKGGVYTGERGYVALKLNANFPENPARTGMPTIQGAILLCDADNGALLAILDSAEITLRRTAAASALAARCLALRNACTLLLCGCGVQARAHAEALAELFCFDDVWCWDRDLAKADALAAHIRQHLALPASAVADFADAAPEAEIIVTSTTATAPFLGPQHVSPGAFIAAIGADNPNKSELKLALAEKAAIVCDSISQCAAMGDLHHALAAAAVSLDRVRAELGDVVAGRKPGRLTPGEIVVFDSTGLAVQDAAAAATAYARAIAAGRGLRCALQD